MTRSLALEKRSHGRQIFVTMVNQSFSISFRSWLLHVGNNKYSEMIMAKRLVPTKGWCTSKVLLTYFQKFLTLFINQFLLKIALKLSFKKLKFYQNLKNKYLLPKICNFLILLRFVKWPLLKLVWICNTMI